MAFILLLQYMNTILCSFSTLKLHSESENVYCMLSVNSKIPLLFTVIIVIIAI